jgi:hypothetical protein
MSRFVEVGLFDPDQWGAPAYAHDQAMISLEDCVELCGLTEEQVLAIAQHEHIPEIIAAVLGNYLVGSPKGELCIKEMIRDDISQAASAGDRGRELALKLALRRFIAQHPHCEARHLTRIRYPDRRLDEPASRAREI